MKPRAEAASRPIRLRLSPAEWAITKQAARVNQQDFSAFARDALLSASADCLEGCPPHHVTLQILVTSSQG